jgi:DNA damage-binding protein 1
MVAVGLWDENKIMLFRLIENQFEKITETKSLGDVLSRSILLTKMDRIVYLMVALGNGTLYYYQFNDQTGELAEEKKATLGTRPVKLKRFFARNTVNVFACSDRPAVIFPSNQKLVFSNVNLKSINEMCLLNSSAFNRSLVLADSERFFIGIIDDIQKLHIRTVPLCESVSRIAYQEETKTIAILTSRQEVLNST